MWNWHHLRPFALISAHLVGSKQGVAPTRNLGMHNVTRNPLSLKVILISFPHTNFVQKGGYYATYATQKEKGRERERGGRGQKSLLQSNLKDMQTKYSLPLSLSPSLSLFHILPSSASDHDLQITCRHYKYHTIQGLMIANLRHILTSPFPGKTIMNDISSTIYGSRYQKHILKCGLLYRAMWEHGTTELNGSEQAYYDY